MTNPERYAIRRTGSAATLRWNRGTYYYAIAADLPTLVTLDVAEALAAEHGGYVVEVTL
jgi:hypothetical protein